MSNYDPLSAPPPLPVRPQRSVQSNCLLGGLAGCGILLVISIIMVIVAVPNIRKTLSQVSSATQHIAGNTQDARQKLMGINTALLQWKKKHKGDYPASLSQLVPNYLPDNSDLSFQNDSNAQPEQAVYIRPTSSTAPSDIVVRYKTTSFTLSLPGGTQTQTFYLGLTKAGQLVQETYSITPIR